MSDTDRLAAETRRLLDAASPGPWRHVPPSQDGTVHRVVTDAGPEFPFGLLRMDDTGYSKRSSYDQRAADAALIAAAPRLLANWLARSEQTEAVEDDLGRIANENAALAGRLMAERDRLADENRALREQLDAAQLRSIEASNPGIDMEEVRRVRLAYPDHERHETVSRAKYGASLASDIAADGGAAVAEGAEDRGQTDG